jgi:AcrR family transcriptional regulator
MQLARRANDTRRTARQHRSRQTVDAVLDAVTLVLKRHGPGAVTTNRIAVAAGVSIGSLYQYFPDKQSIYRALHERHVGEVREVIDRTLVEYAALPIEDFTTALVQGLIDVHAADPELHRLVTALVPEGPSEFRVALQKTFERVPSVSDVETKQRLFVLPDLIESLVHALADRHPLISLASAKEAAVRAVRAFLDAGPR